MLKVPVIQSGLTQTETIVQIANVFEYLDGIVNHVFDKIGSRIDANSRRVTAIQGRIATANEQVEALKSSKKSIVICSPGKYPGRNDCEGVPSTFAEKDDKAPQLNRDFPISCSATPLGESCLKEKLQFFHVRAKGINKGTQKLDNNCLSLGAAVPNHLSSVSDLYLHNTSEFAYQQRQRARKLDVPERREALERSPSKMENKKLDDATMPHSILHPEEWGARQPGDNFFYSPTINDAPDLEMPDDLPDLPGIAMDIAFGKTNDDRQRPATAGKQSNTGQTKSTADKIVAVQEAVAKEEVDNGAKREEATAPVLPALPSFSAPQETIKCAPPTSSAPSVSSVGGAPAPAPPPPPPPPPALPPLSTAAPAAAATATQPAKAAVSTDARSNLMDAIRKAGGKAKLRAAEPQNPKEGGKQGESKPGSGSAGNLMDDLHKKLMMRRKGISGAKKPENVMDRLSALIPPPVAEARRKDGAAEDEEDWS